MLVDFLTVSSISAGDNCKSSENLTHALTKSFTSQLIVLLSIAMKIGWYNNKITTEKYKDFIQNIKLIPNFLSKILALNEECVNLAQAIKNCQNIHILFLWNLLLKKAQ